VPSSAASRPRITRIVVDLPAPLGPMRPVRFPGVTVKDSPSRATVCPNRLQRPLTSIVASTPGTLGSLRVAVVAAGSDLRPPSQEGDSATTHPSHAGQTDPSPRARDRASQRRNHGWPALHGGLEQRSAESTLAALRDDIELLEVGVELTETELTVLFAGFIQVGSGLKRANDYRVGLGPPSRSLSRELRQASASVCRAEQKAVGSSPQRISARTA
jgi:hypothetical protein